MWSSALLGSALLVACSNATPYNRRVNSSVPVVPISSPSQGSSILETSSTSSTISTTLSDSTYSATSTNSLSSSSVFSTSSSTSLSPSSTSQSTTALVTSSTSSLEVSNSTTSSISTNASTQITGPCTGCVLEAFAPKTTWFDEEKEKKWTSVVVTETVVTEFTTYFTGTAIETIITNEVTLNQSVTVPVYGTENETITHTTPVFTVEPTEGVALTLDAGPTYVIFTGIYGGLDFDPRPTETGFPTPDSDEPTCMAQIKSIPDWQPTATEDWTYFIQTYTSDAPPTEETNPVPLPPGLVDFLKQDPDVQSYFSGSDIATCTMKSSRGPDRVDPSSTPAAFPTMTSGFLPPPPMTSHQPVFSKITGTYISKTYESTSTHVTVRGCFRCNTSPAPPDPTGPREIEPTPPDPPYNPQPNPPDTRRPNVQTPNPPNNQPQPSQPGQRITVGDHTYDVHPAGPTQPPHNNNNQPNEHNVQTQRPGVVIGSHTLTAGQTTTMDGVVVVVPSGGGSSIIVGGKTIAVTPTGPAVLSVGHNTVTANSQGQFVVGSQTLQPGGPAITVDGTTLSLGPGGTIAIVNGVTQTLGNAPFITGAPVLTVGDRLVSATVIGGSTMFVLGNGKTLTPGGVLTVDGTTYSMPKDGSGSTVVVNGVTSTLDAPGLPVLTLNSDSVTATVEGGTTAFILGPSQTLTPGGVITISGTTFSMPASASGSVVVINGVTSTLGQGPITAAPALTINGKTYSATVIDGTTEYILGPGTTLKPGEAITISGTTYSLDPKGTALIINGHTSTIPNMPANNNATTTSTDSASARSTTSGRDPGNFIASGIGISSKAGAVPVRSRGFDKWVEGIVIGIASWILMLV